MEIQGFKQSKVYWRNWCEPPDTRIDKVVRKLSVHSHTAGKAAGTQRSQEELGLPQQLVTEWWSRQKMIQQLLKQEKAIIQVLLLHLPSIWAIHNFTDTLSPENYVIVSYLRPILHHRGKMKTQIWPRQLKVQYWTTWTPNTVTQRLRSWSTWHHFLIHVSARDIMVIKARVVREVVFVSAMPSGSATSETSTESTEEAQSVSKKKRKSLGSFFNKPANLLGLSFN